MRFNEARDSNNSSVTRRRLVLAVIANLVNLAVFTSRAPKNRKCVRTSDLACRGGLMWACAAWGGRGRDAVVECTEYLFIPSFSKIIHKKSYGCEVIKKKKYEKITRTFPPE